MMSPVRRELNFLGIPCSAWREMLTHAFLALIVGGFSAVMIYRSLDAPAVVVFGTFGPLIILYVVYRMGGLAAFKAYVEARFGSGERETPRWRPRSARADGDDDTPADKPKNLRNDG